MPDKTGRWYVVETSEYFDGNVYVTEEHVEQRRAEQQANFAFLWDEAGELQAFPLLGRIAVSHGEMLRHPPLWRALEAWEAGDDSMFDQEMTALDAVATAEGAVSDE